MVKSVLLPLILAETWKSTAEPGPAAPRRNAPNKHRPTSSPKKEMKPEPD